MKTVDLNKTIYELTEQHPELIPILVSLGYAGVARPEMRSSHGKEMTILTGVESLGLDMANVVATLRDQGFEVIS